MCNENNVLSYICVVILPQALKYLVLLKEHILYYYLKKHNIVFGISLVCRSDIPHGPFIYSCGYLMSRHSLTK